MITPTTIHTPLTSPTDAYDWVTSLGMSTQKLGLARVQALLDLLGNPHLKLPCLHVAGTNGKGSVVAMLKSVLQQAGLHTGTYTSPHLHHMRERITTSGNPILPEDFLAGMNVIREAIVADARFIDTSGNDTKLGSPTYIEVLTALAFWHFQQKNSVGKLDIALIETGLGGRLDATNVLTQPLLSVITSISLDHTETLGETVELIAAEKAGIIKTGCPVVLGSGLSSSVINVIKEKALSCEAPVSLSDTSTLAIASNSSLEGGLHITDTAHQHHYQLGLLGLYEKENLATVLTIVRQLRQQGFDISEAALQTGLKKSHWPVRFQYMPNERIVLDGSHNPAGLEALATSLAFYAKEKPLYWLLSLKKNRDVSMLCELIARHANTQHILLTTGEDPDSFHSPEAIADTLRHALSKPIPISTVANAKQGYQKLKEQTQSDANALGVITGSLYTAGLLAH